MTSTSDENFVQSAPGSSKQKSKEVITNDFGIPIGSNCNKISSRMGRLVCTHVPISYTTWTKVPQTYKDDVWNGLLKEFDLLDTSRKCIEKKMGDAFKRNKYKLRKNYYKTKATQEERKRNVPPGKCRQEDWLRFCDNENTEKAAIMQEQNTLNRSLLDYDHATGRTGHAKIEAEMRDELEDPTELLHRAKTWIRVRTRKDGSILPSVVPYVEKLVKLIETQNGCNERGQSLDNDALSQVFTKESRGRIRGIPGISKTEYIATAPLRAKFTSIRAESTNLKSCVNKLEEKIFQKFVSVDKVLEHILRGVSLPTEDAPHAASHVFSTSTSATEYEHDVNVRIVNLAEKTVAYGRVCKDKTSGIVHGYHLKDNEVKILVDKVVMPEEYLYKGKQGFAETYGEVGAGSYVFHHIDFLKNP